MSRIGKKPIKIPSDLKLDLNGNVITFSKGNLSYSLDTKSNVKFELKNGELIFNPKDSTKSSKAFWGTYRALSNNIIIGLVEGFEKKLEINGVGYKAVLKAKELELYLGYSHIIKYPILDGVNFNLEKNILSIKGSDKQKVGQVAAEIRSFRPPEPYKGKGIKYIDEVIIRKEGKAAKAKGGK